MKNKLIWTILFCSFVVLTLTCLLLIFYTDFTCYFIFVNFLIPLFLVSVLVSVFSSISYWLRIDNLFKSKLGDSTNLKVDFIDNINQLSSYYEQKIHRLEELSSFTLSLMNRLNEGVLIFNEKEKIVFTNNSIRKILFKSALIQEQLVCEVFKNPHLNKHIEYVIETKKSREGEVIFSFLDDRTFFYRIIPITTFIKSSDKEEYLLIIQDLTTIRKLEKVRTEFVSNVSHELKSPLAAIMGFTETLETEDNLPDQIKIKYLKIIMKNVKKMDSIINDLLVLSKVENAEQLIKKPFLLSEALHDSSEMCKKETTNKNIKIVFLNEFPDIKIIGNQSLITQVFRNLLENAIKYSDKDKTIHVSLKQSRNTIQISFKDHGYGIPPHELERIFERFYQVEKSRTENAGSGLGLSIVKHVINMHNGRIQVKSNYKEGSVFTVTLPVN
ncbi:MAG: GHKL domain-containing protein [Caldisericia bacterium]|nr:GHKL domain-containing protein [Caldisericia bacterium]